MSFFAGVQRHGFTLVALLASWLATVGMASAAEESGAPATVAVGFKTAMFGRVRLTRTGDTKFLTNAVLGGGVVTADAEPGWRARPDAPYGEGVLDCVLDRAQLAGDLALVLRADWGNEANVAIQLLNAEGKTVAADLFGNAAENHRTAVATDTFLVPLSRYPQAVRLSVRRLHGGFTVQKAGLFPVAGDIPADPATRRALAVGLGLVPPDTGVPTQEAEGRTESAMLGTLHFAPALAQVNEVGAAVLAQPGYPVFHRLTAGPLAPAEMANSGTTEDFFRAAQRFLSMDAQSVLRKSTFTSSDGVAAYLLSGRVKLGLMSVPLTETQKADFQGKQGFPILEFAVARDAIEVLVNTKNPLRELTLAQLESIYSGSPRGGSATVKDWNELGAGGGEIKVYGGSPGWGTSKVFQVLVMPGGMFRSDMEVRDVVYRAGVESAVAGDVAGVGYASLRPRQQDVRALAIAAKPGDKAALPDAESIYGGSYPLQRTFYGYLAYAKIDEASPLERELVNLLMSDVGQTMVARSGSLPLRGQEVAKIRAELGILP